MAIPFRCDLQGLVETLERATAPLGGVTASAGSASDAAPRTFVS